MEEPKAAIAIPEPPRIIKVGEDRRFDDARIQAAIARALEFLPENKHIAAVAYATNEGARIAVVGRAHGDIEWTVAADRPWKGQLRVEAAVRWSR